MPSVKSASLVWVMCWSLLGGAEVECNHHQLIPGSNANLLCWVFISVSSSKSQILSSMPEKLGMQLIFSDNLDTSNILFLYPFPLLKSSRRSCISCRGFMFLFLFFLTLETYCLFHQYHSFIYKLHFIHIFKWPTNRCKQCF